jgi:hypothetical protein
MMNQNLWGGQPLPPPLLPREFAPQVASCSSGCPPSIFGTLPFRQGMLVRTRLFFVWSRALLRRETDGIGEHGVFTACLLVGGGRDTSYPRCQPIVRLASAVMGVVGGGDGGNGMVDEVGVDCLLVGTTKAPCDQLPKQ